MKPHARGRIWKAWRQFVWMQSPIMGMHTGTGDNFLIEENIFLLNAKCLLLTKRNLQIILVQSMDTLSIANRSLFLLFTALVFSVIITITEAGHQILLFEWNSIKFLKYRNAQRAPGCVPKNQNVGRWTRSCPSLGICPSHSSCLESF